MWIFPISAIHAVWCERGIWLKADGVEPRIYLSSPNFITMKNDEGVICPKPADAKKLTGESGRCHSSTACTHPHSPANFTRLPFNRQKISVWQQPNIFLHHIHWPTMAQCSIRRICILQKLVVKKKTGNSWSRRKYRNCPMMRIDVILKWQ